MHPELDLEGIFGLNKQQLAAAQLRQKNLIVTAGAGSGKTRTLVARYISLLADGLSARQIAAITFTKKAAREMRNRVRQELGRLKSEAPDEVQATWWGALESQMDAARIGTIHSLCSEILRNHPAEAGLDPNFEPLEEGVAAALQAQIVEDTLTWAVDQSGLQALFENFETSSLAKLVSFALERRLDLNSTHATGDGASNAKRPVFQMVGNFLRDPTVTAAIDQFESMQADGSMRADAGDKLSAQLQSLLAYWRDCRSKLAHENLLGALASLYDMRTQSMGLRAGSSTSLCKQSLRELRQVYDHRIRTWLKEPPDPAVEAAFERVQPLLEQLFAEAQRRYRAALDERAALDFDDLEGMALGLLEHEPVRRRWQQELRALLVDEFQDTNPRQRAIIDALTKDQVGKLFVVGDERQSIYRFRGADVRVFEQMKANITASGGREVPIQRTFRAHQDLLEGTGDLLEVVMQPEQEPQPDYWVAFSPLEADRTEAEQHMQPPHIEFIIGVGEDAGAGRETAARALAQRLWELKEAGQIQRWEQIGLLFRASSNFPIYEDALEAAGIPYVTVAGRGFYDRPEIRDTLNILAALADPWDDLAMAGLLRSPAFGLSDAALYQLRWPHKPSNAEHSPDQEEAQPQSFKAALRGDLSQLSSTDRWLAQRAADFLEALEPLVNRVPVAELLKANIDYSDYRAVLASAQSRLWRNLDKLLEDAHTSGMVSVRAFLDYLETLRDVGAREGEAPLDAEGALQLMTVHKSKGLEFDLVVIADASHGSRSWPESAYLLPETGLAYKLDRFETQPLLYKLAKKLENDQSNAEEKRLQYVAATRAREKLLINGHIGKSVTGWLKELGQAAGLDLKSMAEKSDWRETFELPSGQLAALWVLSQEADSPKQESHIQPRPLLNVEPHLGSGAALYQALPEAQISAGEMQPESQETPSLEVWQVSGTGAIPSWVVGKMVHRAIQRWLFPGDPHLRRLLESQALQAGLVDDQQKAQALDAAEGLLKRLQTHPLHAEIEAAAECHHEVPYSLLKSGRSESGFIDVLYRNSRGWNLLDFKSDALQTLGDLEAAVEKHLPQMRRYRDAVRATLGELPRVRLCFLDCQGAIEVVDVFDA
ncbi:MAG: UvrD-helicase domain-containing protein [Anaerolineales bacterium]